MASGAGPARPDSPPVQSVRSRAIAQWFCLIGGAVLLLRGAVGVALDPAFETPGEGCHQTIHLVSGAILLLASRSARPALILALGFGLVYAAVAVAGIADGADVA